MVGPFPQLALRPLPTYRDARSMHIEHTAHFSIMSFSTTTLANGIASILGFDNKPTTHPSLDHPLDPLSASELAEVIAIVKSHFASIAPTARVYNKPISLIEPPKKQLQPWLDTWHVTQDKSKLQPLPRKASLVVGVKTETTSWKGEPINALFLLMA